MIIKHITNLAIAMALSQTLSAETNYFEAGKATLADLIEIESTESAGLATKASEYASEKLKSVGFGEDDLQIDASGYKTVINYSMHKKCKRFEFVC